MRLIAARLGEALLALWGVVSIVFVVTRLLGDPAILLLPIGATETQLQALRTGLGLDRPLLAQYAGFLWGLAQGDFGQSYQFGRSALGVVLERMPATALLAGTAIAIGVAVGGVAGAVAALYRGTLLELAVMLLALLGQATPVFWLGIMLVLLFAVDLGWLPTGGYGDAAHLVLPALALASFTTASIARLLRSSLIEAEGQDFVRTARAKGLAPRRVFLWHVARLALIPVLTMVAILAGELLGGSVVTETVFAWPGVGRLIVQAIEAKDFPVVQAGVTVVAALFIAINLGVDLLYGVLDPRIGAAR